MGQREGQGHLLGDSGYTCRKYLLTPYENPAPDSYQERYNKQQSRGRITIECAFGIYKNLFQCLHYGLRYDLITCCKIILACACLHNLRYRFAEPEPTAEMLQLSRAVNNNDERNMEYFGLEESDEEIEHGLNRKQSEKSALADGRLYRDRLALQYFP